MMNIKDGEIMDNKHEQVKLEKQLPAMIGVLDKETFHSYFIHDTFVPEHWHRSLELCLHENIEVMLRMENKEYYIKDDFTCINSGVVHSLSGSQVEEISDNARSIVVLISYDFMKYYYPDIDNILFDLSLKENHDDLKKLYHRLEKLYTNQDEFTYLQINACLLEIFSLLLREYKVEKHSSYKKNYKKQEQVKNVLTYIQEHYQEDLSLSFMAEQCHMSKEYFSRQFHQFIGKTFKDYLSAYRLYKAYDDIVNTEISIQEIAMKHGFLNVKSLIKSFSDTYHETPLQYRKKMSRN